ncbi:MFS transporter [Nesterenkonia rhizosphaerae]|uniref:YbfB/YjiJ family MFS transporter n=1 Tax=Nesterenkonia rhizosphaerae TaxID=1348272 RepID=A0ABP9FSS4_9MICC
MSTTSQPTPSSHGPSPQPWWAIAGTGAAVIAICYGFARYAYGLFVPEFAAAFDLAASGIGMLGGISTLGYTAGLFAAPLLANRSSRAATITAGASASLGLLTIGLAPVLPVFAAGLFLAGTSAGLVSPAVAQLVTDTVASRIRPRAQTWANIGTSFGLAASAFTPLLNFGWRVTWVGFGVVAGLVTLAAVMLLPRTRGATVRNSGAQGSRFRRPGLVVLLAHSLLLGLTSVPYWNFSIQRLQDLGADGAVAAWFWLCIGAAGLLGGLTGSLSGRFGLTRVNVAVWTLWAVALGVMALPEPSLIALFVSAGLFGAAFMALTGVCILWAARLYPKETVRGVTLSFFFLGIGQTLGSPLAGAVADGAGLGAAFAGAAVLSLLVWLQLFPSLRAPEDGYPHQSRSPS